MLMEYSGATRDAIMKAEENLHPSKISLNNFRHDIKAWPQYAHTNLTVSQAPAAPLLTPIGFIL
jgi:hypothetical protein